MALEPHLVPIPVVMQRLSWVVSATACPRSRDKREAPSVVLECETSILHIGD